MDTSQTLSGTESPTRCPICLEYHSTDTAVLMPCAHKYDVACIAVQLKMFGERSRQCPMCRAKIWAVKYAFPPDGMYKIHIPGKGYQDANPFLRDDEIVPPGASEQERRRKFELRNFRTLQEIPLQSYRQSDSTAVAFEHETYISVNRNLTLAYRQRHGFRTSCILERSLSLHTLKTPPKRFRDGKNFEPEKIATARGEIIKCLDNLEIKSFFSKVKIQSPKYLVKCDDRGLRAAAMRSLTVQRKLGEEDISIRESVAITEEYLAELPGEEELRQDMVRGVERREREKEVMMVRQEMQGLFRLFEQVDTFEMLDRGTTGILEEGREEDKECRYCDVRHRNGDCRLPNMDGLSLEERGEAKEEDAMKVCLRIQIQARTRTRIRIRASRRKSKSRRGGQVTFIFFGRRWVYSDTHQDLSKAMRIRNVTSHQEPLLQVFYECTQCSQESSLPKGNTHPLAD